MTLPPPLWLVVLAGAACLPGAIALALIERGRPRRPDIEALFAALSLGLLVAGWAAVTLAEIGRFSRLALLLLWLASLLAAGAWWLRRRRGAGRASRRETPAPGPALATSRACGPRWEGALLLVWAIAASALFFRPHEFLVGGADAGVYVNLGANIARTGSILIHDPQLAALDPALDRALLRSLPPSQGVPYYLLPGFYVPGQPRGLVVPQFYPLHPVWQAVGYAFGGLRTELLMTPFWALLGCLAIYLAVRRLWGWQPALLALAILTLTGVETWFARYPTAEMLTQYLFWTGVWALAAWLGGREPRGLWAALAGMALGEVFLARIDVYALLLALPVLALWLRWSGRWRRADAWFFVTCSLLALHSLAHGIWQSGPYFFGLFGYGLQVLGRTAPAAVALAILAGVTLWILDRRARWRSRIFGWVGARATLWRGLAAVAVAGLALYAYFIRPLGAPAGQTAYWYGGGSIPNVDPQNLVRLGWYLSPLGLALGVAGVCRLIWRDRRPQTTFLLAAGLFFTVFYVWRVQANPHQVYATRRYMPVVMPFLIAAGAYLLAGIYNRTGGRGRWMSVALGVVWLGSTLYAARGLIVQVDYRGMDAQLARFSAALQPGSVLIFNDPAAVGLGDLIGTPLHFLYGHEVFTIRDPKAADPAALMKAIRGWQERGQAVYWVGSHEGYPWPPGGLALGPATPDAFTGATLEATYDHRPQSIVPFNWALSVAPVAPEPGAAAPRPVASAREQSR